MQQNELTVKVILLSIILTVVLAAANTFLALKIGMLTSASIPASVLSIAIFRCFGKSTILENNLVQTAASAGEAVAGGVVYTVPALVIIGFWQQFSYFENMLIALMGGLLGVIFTVPLRRILVKQPSLPFPEGQAIAQVLHFSKQGTVKHLLLGGVIGALLELCQAGLKVIANDFEVWFSIKRMLVGFGLGFSATLIGAGYLIGSELAFSIMLGAVIGWLIAVPFFSEQYTVFALHYIPSDAVARLWDAKVRYMGIGAMLFAGLWSFITMLKPLSENIMLAWRNSENHVTEAAEVPSSDKDIPLVYLMLLASLLSAIMFVFFELHLPLPPLGYEGEWLPTLTFFLVCYVFVIGFIFSVVTGFFSGMVGVSASPGSSVIIGGMLMIGWLLSVGIEHHFGHSLTLHQMRCAEAVTIIVGAVITGVAAIANDNIQDLKVGYLIGATPWKQQVMLMLGVVVAALVIPPIMHVLFNVYGIANVMPFPHTDVKQTLPAPPAALMAAITQAIFHHGLPWPMLLTGVAVIAGVIILNQLLQRSSRAGLSVLGVAIGIYLPMTTSVPLSIGGCFAMFCQRIAHRNFVEKDHQSAALQPGLMLACGLVAGASLMDVLLAIPFAMAHSPDLFQVDWLLWHGSNLALAIASTLFLGWLFVRLVTKPV